jgi:hypothetical protein
MKKHLLLREQFCALLFCFVSFLTFYGRKATGFIGGTGHGSTFQDSQGRYWHADTALIGVRHPFERRLMVFPSGFFPTGSGPNRLVAQTYLGDYPDARLVMNERKYHL